MTYNNAKIYKLWCYETDDVYVGSTTQKLSNRLYQHKSKLNCSSKILFEKSDNVKIELIEEFPCENKNQLKQREGHFIREINCVNKRIAGRTIKEYYQDNYEQIREQQKQYKKQIREQQCKKYECHCCGKYTHVNKLKHLKTQKHLNWEKNKI